MIFLENVEEFEGWSPVYEEGKAKPEEKGITFRRWVKALRAEGYKVEWRQLRACDYGAPTIRKRLFLIARRDGLPIVWPETDARPRPAAAVPHGGRHHRLVYTVPVDLPDQRGSGRVLPGHRPAHQAAPGRGDNGPHRPRR